MSNYIFLNVHISFYFLYLSAVIIHQFHSYAKTLTLILLITTPVTRNTPLISIIPTLIPRIPIIPTLIPRIPRIPTLIRIIPTLIPALPLFPSFRSPIPHSGIYR